MGYIYWIASYPKSGNTWMRAFLASIVLGGDVAPLDQLKDFAPDDNYGPAFAPFLNKPVQFANLRDLAEARPRAHAAMAAASSGFLFVKTHSLVTKHLGTPTITPAVTAGAIYIIRNPLDVAVSYAEFKSRDIDTTIDLMLQSGRILPKPQYGSYQVAGSWQEHVTSWAQHRHDQILVVRYEDMLAEPRTAFGSVVKFLRLDVDEAALDRALAATAFDVLKRTEQAKGFNERPKDTKVFFRAGQAGQWRSVLSEEQIRRIAIPNEIVMRNFGYWEPGFDALT